jgi:hypothetical protein
MRNLFDQYSQPENRLTHALLSCLSRDRRLLRQFVRWIPETRRLPRTVEVLGQALPGEFGDISEAEAERRGLPDGCITDGAGWALLIESKFAAAVSVDQLRRHLRTAARHGLTECKLLLLTVGAIKHKLPANVIARRWSEVYQWLARQGYRSKWAQVGKEYLEVAEARGVEQEYLKEGTVTVFSGIPFGRSEPYSYIQAKRVLGLFLDELRKERRLQLRLGTDPDSKGRGAITGRAGQGVWDFLSLKSAAHSKLFTEFPHLTVGIRDTRLEIYVTVPNGVRSEVRKNVLGHSYEEFERLIQDVHRRLSVALRKHHGASPMIVLVQRHYPSQRSPAIHDAQLRFDSTTAFGGFPSRRRVKHQPEWLRVVHDVLKNRRSNLQFQVGADLPYDRCPVVASPKITEVAVAVWLACEPLVKTALRS